MDDCRSRRRKESRCDAATCASDGDEGGVAAEPQGAMSQKPNKAPEPTTMAVTPRAPSSTRRASHGRGSSLTLGKMKCLVSPRFPDLTTRMKRLLLIVFGFTVAGCAGPCVSHPWTLYVLYPLAVF